MRTFRPHSPSTRMLTHSHEMLVAYGTSRVPGFYEISTDKRILARRVDIPEWAFDASRNSGSLLSKIQQKKISPPKGAHGHGHIFWYPIEVGFEVPAVGVDRSIFDQVIRNGPVIKTIFVIQCDNRVCERWRIVSPVFKAFGRTVQPSQAFEPQVMVPVTNLVLEPSL